MNKFKNVFKLSVYKGIYYLRLDLKFESAYAYGPKTMEDQQSTRRFGNPEEGNGCKWWLTTATTTTTTLIDICRHFGNESFWRTINYFRCNPFCVINDIIYYVGMWGILCAVLFWGSGLRRWWRLISRVCNEPAMLYREYGHNTTYTRPRNGHGVRENWRLKRIIIIYLMYMISDCELGEIIASAQPPRRAASFISLGRIRRRRRQSSTKTIKY